MLEQWDHPTTRGEMVAFMIVLIDEGGFPYSSPLVQPDGTLIPRLSCMSVLVVHGKSPGQAQANAINLNPVCEATSNRPLFPRARSTGLTEIAAHT
jgi:hypothetical protein